MFDTPLPCQSTWEAFLEMLRGRDKIKHMGRRLNVMDLQSIGAAVLPEGVTMICKILIPFPKADYADVWDMRGVKYRNIDLDKIRLTGNIKPTYNLVHPPKTDN